MPGYSFEDLEVYKAARRYRKKIYALPKRLPVEEKYNLASQMRRAATSLTNNIAEGRGQYHDQANTRFLRQSRGSLEELLHDLNICLDEQHFQESGISILKTEDFELLHKINGYIAYLKKRKITADNVSTVN